LNGRDLRALPLVERKKMLRRLVPPQPAPIMYVSHLPKIGTDLYQAVCEQDMEGIVCKRASGTYTPDAQWIKVKNPRYSLTVGRADFFNGRRA
jgi:ATP-dependent DNA ligase